MAADIVRRATVEANGADLYCEIRGNGSPLLFVSGASGDAGQWDRIVDAFAPDHTVVTYDRRGNSRSRAPAGGATSSVEEQADDAAALIEVLRLAPTTVVGSSGGARITLAFLQRHPRALRAALVHEPPLFGLLPEGAAPALGERIADGMAAVEQSEARGTPSVAVRTAMERFLRMAFGSSIFDSIEPQLRERMLANGQVFFRTEKDFRTWNPDLTRLRSCGVPIVVAAGRDTKGHPEVGFLYETSVRLAEGLGLPLEEVAGEHVPYVSHPEAFSSELRAILERLGG